MAFIFLNNPISSRCDYWSPGCYLEDDLVDYRKHMLPARVNMGKLLHTSGETSLSGPGY